jgi:hypothetical protein
MTTAKITKKHIASVLAALALATPGAAFASAPTQPNAPKAPAMEHKDASKAEKKKAKADATKKAAPDQKAAVRH